ncbi:hypothetical protein HID58_061770, partial [Brassica napus]
VDGSLMVVNLCGCHSLEAIPVLSNHKSLEKLASPGTVHAYSPKLIELLVDVSGQKHLEKLVLSSCSNLSILP